MTSQQKYTTGTRVRIADDLGPHMNHFPSGKSATVLYSFAQKYGGDDVKSYCLDIDGKGVVSWYQEHQLTPILTQKEQAMTPQKRAAIVAAELGMDFTKTLLEHLDESSYIYSSPDCFILAVDAVREFGENCQEEAIFVTLAVGKLTEFLEIDPRKETRKWLGYCRENGGEVHWIQYQKLRKLRKHSVCQSCKKLPASEMHTCPFSEEIYHDSDTLCNCCDKCAYQCARDI